MSKITSLQMFLDRWIDEPALTVAIERYEIPTEDNFWQWRELYRIYKEDISKPSFPFIEDLDKIHNVHIDPEDPKFLRYYPDEDKGKRDISTKIKFGRYLTQFYGDHFDNEKIKELVAEHLYQVSPAELLFVPEDDRDLAEKIYEEGPASCMRRDRGHLHSRVHPCRAYPTNNMTIAYVKKGDRITARTIVNTDDKKYARIYGDEGMLGPLLRAEGYRKSSNALLGCRLHRIKEASDSPHLTEDRGMESVVLPYLDGEYTRVGPDPTDPEHYFIICNGSRYNGQQTFSAQAPGGVVHVTDLSHMGCIACGNRFPRDTLITSHQGAVCSTCNEEHFVDAENADGSTIRAQRTTVVTAPGHVFADAPIARQAGYTSTYRGWALAERTITPPTGNTDVLEAFAVEYQAVSNAGTTTNDTVDVNEFLPNHSMYWRTTVDPTAPAHERYTYNPNQNDDNLPNSLHNTAAGFLPLLSPGSQANPNAIAEELTNLTGVTYNPLRDPLVQAIITQQAMTPPELIEHITPITLAAAA